MSGPAWLAAGAMLALLGEPIALEEIDARGLAALRRNPGGKLRLINVWATWCAPCVVEMPDLVAIDRAFRGPRFETVTVSADDADRRDPALALLRRVKATTTNYRFQGERPALTEALDPAWGGALPFTLLVAPGGQVLFRNEGTLEIDRLRRTIDEWLRRRERRPSSPLR